MIYFPTQTQTLSVYTRDAIISLTSNEKILENEEGKDGEKVKKQDGMSMIIVNSDKIILSIRCSKYHLALCIKAKQLNLLQCWYEIILFSN